MKREIATNYFVRIFAARKLDEKPNGERTTHVLAGAKEAAPIHSTPSTLAMMWNQYGCVVGRRRVRTMAWSLWPVKYISFN